MNLTPFPSPVTQTISMPSSKSYTNRALVIAALRRGSTILTNPLHSEDTEAMCSCLVKLGAALEIRPEQITVQSDLQNIPPIDYTLSACDSGTTMRFILALSCVVPGVQVISGNPRLSERPIRDLVDALRNLGAHIEYCDQEGQLPIRVRSSSLFASPIVLKGDMSSQFCSAILLIAPQIVGGLDMRVQGLISAPYVDMTLGCMRECGVEVIVEAQSEVEPLSSTLSVKSDHSLPRFSKDVRYRVLADQSYRSEKYAIEGDYSSGGYFFAIAALTRSRITVQNLCPHSLQPDRKLLDTLAIMGNEVVYHEDGLSIHGRSIEPMDVNMEDFPDQVMTVAVLASFAEGRTRIFGISSLRYKETDRLFALRQELYKMGITTEETHNSLTIYGGQPHGARIATYNDHRIAMAFAVAGTKIEGMTIENPRIVNKTFPAFWEILDRLQRPSLA